MKKRIMCLLCALLCLLPSLFFTLQWVIYRRIDVLSSYQFAGVESIMVHLIENGRANELSSLLADDLKKKVYLGAGARDAKLSGHKTIGILYSRLLQTTGGIEPDLDQLLSVNRVIENGDVLKAPIKTGKE